MRRFRLVAVVAAAHAVCLPLGAQQGETLSQLREDHKRTLATATRTVDDVYRLTLRQLEKQRTEAADYEGAQRVKAKLEAIDKRPGAAVIIPKPLTTCTLLASQSQTRDGANTDGSRQYVDFKKVGGKAVWGILSIELGTYEVFLTYSVGLPVFNPEVVRDASESSTVVPGGMVAFSEVSGLAASGPEPLEKRITTTGHWDNYIRESLGRYECRRGSPTVRVEATAATAGGLMHLRQVELVRVSGPAAAAAGTPSGSGDALKELQIKHRNAIATASSAVRSKFAVEFEDLEKELNAGGDRAGATAVARARSTLFRDQGDEKLLVAAPAVGADSELDHLERDYLTQRDAIVRPLIAGFAGKLRSLHAWLSQSGDPRADAVKAELDRIVLRLSLPPGADEPGVAGTPPSASEPGTGRAAAGPVELRGPKAALTGGAVYDEKVAAVQFKAKGATAVWNLPDLKPGRYRVRFDCGCAAGLGARALVVFGDQRPRMLTLLPTSESGQVTSMNFGEVEILSGGTVLKVAMLDVPPRTKGSGGFTLQLIAITLVETTRAE